MATPTSYTYSIPLDCPGGIINPTRLYTAIAGSAIATQLNWVNTENDTSLIINFADVLSTGDENILDGGTGSPHGTHPAGGLIASTSTDPVIPNGYTGFQGLTGLSGVTGLRGIEYVYSFHR